MNELETARKNELLKAMSATELAPLEVKNEISVQTYSKIPLSRLTALGTGFEPVASAIQQVTSHGQATSGFYNLGLGVTVVDEGLVFFRFVFYKIDSFGCGIRRSRFRP